MSLNAQAIAVSGYGYGAQLMAVSGYGSVAAAEETKTGTGGIDPKRGKKLHLPFKPTGLSTKKSGQKSDNQDIITERLQEQERLAEQFAKGIVPRETLPVEQLSLAEIDFEIGTLLRKKLKTKEENKRITMLLILLAANI